MKPARTLIRSFHGDVRGASAVEFAIMGSVMAGLMIGFFDVAFGMYVTNSFNHAVNAAAREVYVDPARAPEAIKADVESRLSRFHSPIETVVTTETVGSVEFRVIEVTMSYSYKSPFLSKFPMNLAAEGRAPILDYKL